MYGIIEYSGFKETLKTVLPTEVFLGLHFYVQEWESIFDFFGVESSIIKHNFLEPITFHIFFFIFFRQKLQLYSVQCSRENRDSPYPNPLW